jgi:hypothetical protein
MHTTREFEHVKAFRDGIFSYLADSGYILVTLAMKTSTASKAVMDAAF